MIMRSDIKCIEICQLSDFHIERITHFFNYTVFRTKIRQNLIITKMMMMMGEEQNFQQLPSSSSADSNKQYHANQILYVTNQYGRKVFFLPGYLKVTLKNFKELSASQLNIKCNVMLILIIKTRGLPNFIKEQLKENMILYFQRNDPIKLKEGVDEEQETDVTVSNFLLEKHKSNGSEGRSYYGLKFILRKILNARIQPYIALAPFQVLDSILTVSIKTLRFEQNGKKMQVRINLMQKKYQKENIHYTISYTRQCGFGAYDLAENRMHAQYTSEKVPSSLLDLKEDIYFFPCFYFCPCFKRENKRHLRKKQQSSSHEEGKDDLPSERKRIISKQGLNQLMENCDQAHFHFPLYKIPGVTLVTIFVPLIFLGLINLAIFFQEPALGDRVLSIATLMIAFVGLIPIIRDQMPPNPRITVVECIVYLETATTLFCGIQSLIDRNQNQQTYEFKGSPLFVVSVIMTGISVFVPLVMYIVYKIYILPDHNLPVKTDAEIRDQTHKVWNYNDKANQQLRSFKKFNNTYFDPHKIQRYTSQSKWNLIYEQSKKFIADMSQLQAQIEAYD